MLQSDLSSYLNTPDLQDVVGRPDTPEPGSGEPHQILLSNSSSFDLYFCRKSDPQSKGKIENVVKYVKQNFLYNRTYYDIDLLNDQVVGWLERTANSLPHGTSHKEPGAELILERPFLKPYVAHASSLAELKSYTVRKDNSISYKGNFYSLPLGTYKGKGTLVEVYAEGEVLVIRDAAESNDTCLHKILPGRGNKVFNRDHKRDKTAAIAEMIEEVAALFKNKDQARQW